MQPVYRYSTLARVKGRIDPDVISDASITDAQILEQIESVSAQINAWTRQVFQAYPAVERVNGRGSLILTHPSVLPFVRLEAVNSIENRTTGQFKGIDRIIPGMRNFPERSHSLRFYTVDGHIVFLQNDQGGGRIAWEVGSRTINMITLFDGFSKGWKNIEMIGWWGWLEGYKDVSTTVATAIPANTADAATIHVDSVADAESGDIIMPGDTISIVIQDGDPVPKTLEVATVQSIAPNGVSGFDLTVDVLHPWPIDIPVGAKVYCMGRVPKGIQDVAEYMASRAVGLLAADKTGDVATIAALEGNLKSERTDNYSYSLGNVGGSSGSGGNAGSLGKYTGNVKMDLLLRQFVKPSVGVKLI